MTMEAETGKVTVEIITVHVPKPVQEAVLVSTPLVAQLHESLDSYLSQKQRTQDKLLLINVSQ